MSYRSELIQVAAVCVAMITDLEKGTTGDQIDEGFLYDAIQAERQRQERKWGSQHHDPEMWLAILMEEVGEAAKACLEGDYN